MAINTTDRTFLTNIEIERTKLGMTQKQFASILGMSLSNYKKMIAGDVVKIAKYELACLLHKFTHKTIYELCEDNIPEVELIKRFRNLSPQLQKNILSIMEMEEALTVHETSLEDLVPCYVLTGNMIDGMIFDAANIEYINICEHQKLFTESIDCALQITSNHFHPVYHLGDVLLIHQSPPRDGDTGIFINSSNNKIYIRKFRQTQPCELIPVNGMGKTILVDSHDSDDMNQWVKFGYVLTKMR